MIRTRKVQIGLYLTLIVCFAAINAFALEKPGEDLPKAGLTTALGQKVDLNLEFTDTNGSKTALSQLVLPGKPFIILPVYYSCPRLCGLVMGGVQKLLNNISLALGQDFSLVAVSINKEDTYESARKKQDENYAALNMSPDLKKHWHFVVGAEENVKALMGQIGFNYLKDGEEYAHSAAIIILTADGQISQYFTGIDFPKWDVKLALVEASKGRIGSALDHALLFCFRFDPTKGKYTWAAFNLVRTGAALTFLVLVYMIYRLWRSEKVSVLR